MRENRFDGGRASRPSFTKKPCRSLLQARITDPRLLQQLQPSEAASSARSRKADGACCLRGVKGRASRTECVSVCDDQPDLAQPEHKQHDGENDDQHGSYGVDVRPEPTLFFTSFELRKESWSLVARERCRTLA
jgi:hypothetical protein